MKWIEKYNSWRHELRIKWAQRYADLIIIQLEKSRSEWEFDFWMNQGIMLDARMTELYNIYLN